MASQRIPLAWRNLTHQRSRLLIASAGVGFAVVLMFMQTGFRNALFDSTVQIIRVLDADVVIVSKACYSISSARRFPREHLRLAADDPSVETVEPVYLETFASLLRVTGVDGKNNRRHPIRSIGFNVRRNVFLDDEIRASQRRLAEPDTAFLDRRSKQAVFGKELQLLANGETLDSELSGRTIRLIGAFDLSSDFANEGNLLMSQETFARSFPMRLQGGDPLSVVDIGLVKCRGGAGEAAAVRKRLAARLPKDVMVKTRDDFVNAEIKFWADNTPIGAIFNIGVGMGFLVGSIICYQIIFTDLNNHMPEFATLKAMGYPGAFFVRFVLAEAFFLSLFGFLPGMVVSYGLYALLRSQTGLLMALTPLRALFVYGLTLAMCIASGVIAIRKLRSADPASLF